MLQLRLFTRRHYHCFLRAWINSQGQGVIPNAELSFENNVEEQNMMQIPLLIHSTEAYV